MNSLEITIGPESCEHQNYCSECNQCGTCDEFTHVEDVYCSELVSGEMQDRVRWHMDGDFVCTDCLSKILKRIAHEAEQAKVDAKELHGDKYAPYFSRY